MTPPLRAELSAGVLTLTLDRAEKRNALNAAMIGGLHDELNRAELDSDVRVVAVRGAGTDFCAGADLAELLASAQQPMDQNERDALRLGSIFQRIREIPKPVVSVVQGRALAGGAGLATACDIVIAADSARIGYPEIQRGFVPAMVMTLLRRLAGEKAALDLVLTGRLLTADEALRLGLVSRIVPVEQLDTAAHELLTSLSEASGSAVALTKQLFYRLDGLSFGDGIATGARVNALARSTPDFHKAISRFLNP